MTEREKIEHAIAAQESLRATLGDEIVDATIAALRKQLAELTHPPAAEQQRKLVTILFADIVDSTKISEYLDPEDAMDMMDQALRTFGKIVQDERGMIGRFMGDGLLAFFGVPTATENAPERAICAGLRIQQAAQTYARHVAKRWGITTFAVRVGINTGLVVMGEMGGTGHPDYTAMGDAVNVAAWLERAAPTDGILISHATYRHVRGVFEVAEQAPLTLEGRAEPIQTYVVTRLKPRAFRLGSRGVEGIETRMIGRGAELRQLQEAFHTVIENRELQMVTIVGEAGIGKSRLLYEFENWAELQPENFRIFKGRASEQTRNLPYFLIRDLFAFRFQIAESDPLEIVHEKMEQGIAEFMGVGHEEKAHFIGHLLGYHYSESSHLRGILNDPKQIRNLALYYLTQFFAAVAKEMPAVILLEDMHWADDGSLEVIQYLAQECRQFPILIICCTRPPLFERRPFWDAPSTFPSTEQYIRLNLHPLSRRDSRRLVREILRKVSDIPAELHELIVNGAEGNPFYVEELIKMLIEEEVIVKENEPSRLELDEGWRVEMKQLAEVKVPPTLIGVLQARLDSLSGIERDVLQRASVIGRVFWDKAVEKLMRLESSERLISSESLMSSETLSIHQTHQTQKLQKTFQRLRNRELIFRRKASAFEGTREYLFKHALLRDVTYESVLRRQRRNLHAQAATWLIERSGTQVEQYAGLIGEHYEKARQPTNAVEWYGRAGKQAQEAYAPETAIDYYQKALALLGKDQTSRVLEISEVYDYRITLYEGLGGVLHNRARYVEAIDAYTAMRFAAENAADLPAQIRAWNELAWVQEMQSNYHASLESAERAEMIARNTGTDVQMELVMVLIRKSRAFWRLGDFEQALELAEEVLTRSTELDARHEIALALNVLGIVNGTLGSYDQSISYYEKALAIFRELGNRDWVSGMLNNLAEIARSRGDYESALHGYQEALVIAQKIGDRVCETLYLSNIGGTRVELGEYATAEADLRQAIEMVGDTGMFFLSWTYSYLAKACLGQGKVEEALKAAQQAMTLAQDSKYPEFFCLAWCVLGQVAALVSSVRIGGSDYTAEECFADSLRVCKESGMEGEQAKTLKAWAEYELRQGNREKGEALWQEARVLFEKLGMEMEEE